MQDPRLRSPSDKTQSFFWGLFESSDIKRTAQPDIDNALGIRWYVDNIRMYKKAEALLDKLDGKFCWCETLTANYARFIFQWVDAFSSRVENVGRMGRSLSHTFVPAFAGGLINAGTILAASHFAANRAHTDNGLNLVGFWVLSQFYTLLAVPATALAERLINPNITYSQGLWRAARPSRLAFNAAFAFAIGAYNNSSEVIRLLYWPSIIAAGVLQRVANTPSIFDAAQKTGLLRQLSAKDAFGLNRLELVRGGALSVGAFTLLNFLFPVTLTQSRTKKELHKEYLDYVKETDENAL
jgi:hypothetical protein